MSGAASGDLSSLVTSATLDGSGRVITIALSAALPDGDTITIDVPNRSLHLHVSDAEIEARLAQWQRPECKFKRGYLALYARLAESADKGAIIRHTLEG